MKKKQKNWKGWLSVSAKLLQVGIFFLIHLFAWEILLLKKLEIEETKVHRDTLTLSASFRVNIFSEKVSPANVTTAKLSLRPNCLWPKGHSGQSVILAKVSLAKVSFWPKSNSALFTYLSWVAWACLLSLSFDDRTRSLRPWISLESRAFMAVWISASDEVSANANLENQKHENELLQNLKGGSSKPFGKYIVSLIFFDFWVSNFKLWLFAYS